MIAERYFIIINIALSAVLLIESGCTPAPVYTSAGQPGKYSAKNTSTIIQSGKPINVSEEQKQCMLKEIEAWKGTPYRFGRCERGKGTDCSGFVGHIFRHCLKIELPRQAADIYMAGKNIPEKDLVFGDLVFLKNTYSGAKGASHVGIYIGNGKMAHASTIEGVTISDLSEKYYKKHFLGYRRFIIR